MKDEGFLNLPLVKVLTDLEYSIVDQFSKVITHLVRGLSGRQQDNTIANC